MKSLACIVSACAILSLSSCGGGGGSPNSNPASGVTIGGNVTGLSGSVTLQNNNSDNLNLSSNGAFQFSTDIPKNSNYNVTVLTQPPSQDCSISNASGIADSNVSDVIVSCADVPLVHTIGGTVNGLNGTLVLQNNGSDDLTVTSDGSFQFASALADNRDYSVTVLTQPIGQDCTLSNATGTATTDVTGIIVNCSDAATTLNFSFTAQRSSGSVITDDFDNDGNLDFASPVAGIWNNATNGVDGGFSVFFGDGSGSFTLYDHREPSPIFANPIPVSIGRGDLNGDGYLDIAVSFFQDILWIYTNNGNRTFSLLGELTIRDLLPLASQFNLNSPKTIQIKDFNNDAINDILVTTETSINVFINNNDGSFQNANVSYCEANTTSFDIGDFNNDGFDNIFCSDGHDEGTLSIGSNNGSFTASAQALRLTIPDGDSALVAEDFNEDGNLDVVVSGGNVNQFQFLQGDGAGLLSQQQSFATGGNPGDLIAADFDSDGHLDIATSNNLDRSVTLYRGVGDGTFSNRKDVPALPALTFGDESTSLDAGDFDGNGTPDIVVIGSDNAAGSTATIILNPSF